MWTGNQVNMATCKRTLFLCERCFLDKPGRSQAMMRKEVTHYANPPHVSPHLTATLGSCVTPHVIMALVPLMTFWSCGGIVIRVRAVEVEGNKKQSMRSKAHFFEMVHCCLVACFLMAQREWSMDYTVWPRFATSAEHHLGTHVLRQDPDSPQTTRSADASSMPLELLAMQV